MLPYIQLSTPLSKLLRKDVGLLTGLITPPPFTPPLVRLVPVAPLVTLEGVDPDPFVPLFAVLPPLVPLIVAVEPLPDALLEGGLVGFWQN